MLTTSQKKHLADKLMDSANILLASLVIGGIIDSRINKQLVITGASLFIILLVFTTYLRLQK